MYAEEILTQKFISTHVIVREYFCAAMLLLLNFNGADTHNSDIGAEDRQRLEHAMRTMRSWKVVPFLNQSFIAFERIAMAKGLKDTRYDDGVRT